MESVGASKMARWASVEEAKVELRSDTSGEIRFDQESEHCCGTGVYLVWPVVI